MSIFDCKNDLLHGGRITTEFKFVGFIYIYIYIHRVIEKDGRDLKPL